MTYEKLDLPPGRPSPVDNSAARTKCQENACNIVGIVLLVILGAALVGGLLGIFIGGPILAGVCSMHSTETCSVSGGFIYFKNVSYSANRRVGDTNSTQCYYTDNSIAGKGVYLSVSDDIVFGVCAVYTIMSIIFWGILVVILGGWGVIGLVFYCSKYRVCQRICCVQVQQEQP